MWPFNKKEIHNPDCFMCCDFFYPPKVKGTCSRTGCDRPAEGVIYHFWSRGSGARWSYVCYECEREHNEWFYGKPTKNGWLFTPPEGVVLLPPVQYEYDQAPAA